MKLPVLAGEIGSFLVEPLDVRYYDALAAYMANAAATRPHRHRPFAGWIWCACVVCRRGVDCMRRGWMLCCVVVHGCVEGVEMGCA